MAVHVMPDASPASAARTRRMLVYVGAGALAAAGLMAWAAPAASAAPAGCPDVEVVFARGTNEPVGVGRVGQALVDDLEAKTDKEISVYAVNYPASYDFMMATAGANDASAHIQATAANCPSTQLVLGGFSQGAAVMDLVTGAGPLFGFTNVVPPNVADHVAAVAVFGNPSVRIGQPITASPLYGAKAIDLCNGNDPVCSGGDDVSAHSLYVQSGMVSQAADFVVGQLNTVVPPAV